MNLSHAILSLSLFICAFPMDTQLLLQGSLSPTGSEEVELHNVTLALELLRDEGLLSYPINPEDIVNKDPKSTLRVLYSLFCKHRLQENTGGVHCGTPN